MLMSGSLINFDRFHDTETIKQKAMMNAASGGPNSGFEIDGVEFFKQPELANEFPEMKDDIDLIVSTESFVSRLVDFRHRVHEARGMNRSMAVELLELVPSLESHTSTRHFTEELSMIGCEMSLEAIDFKLWAIIAAAVTFVVALIYKFINWLGFGGSDGGGDSSKLDEAKEGIKEAPKKLAEQEKAISKASHAFKQARGEIVEVKVPSHADLKKIENTNMPSPLKKELLKTTKPLGTGRSGDLDQKEHYVKVKLTDVLADLEGGAEVYDYLRNPNKWARIIYNDKSHALDLITTAFEAFESGSSIILGNLGVMEDIITSLETMQDSSDKFTKMEHSARVQSGLSLVSTSLLTDDDFKVGGKTYLSMGQWAVEIKHATSDQSAFAPSFTNLEELLEAHEMAIRRLRDVNFAKILAFIDALKKAEPVLKRFEKLANSEKARERNGLSDHDKARVARADTLMKVATQMTRNFKSLMTVYDIISNIYQEASSHGTMIVEKIRSNAKKIVAFYNKHNEQPPPTLENLVDALEESLKEHKENEIHARMLPATAFVSTRNVGTSHIVIGDDEIQTDYHTAQAALRDIQKASGQSE